MTEGMVKSWRNNTNLSYQKIIEIFAPIAYEIHEKHHDGLIEKKDME